MAFELMCQLSRLRVVAVIVAVVITGTKGLCKFRKHQRSNPSVMPFQGLFQLVFLADRRKRNDDKEQKNTTFFHRWNSKAIQSMAVTKPVRSNKLTILKPCSINSTAGLLFFQEVT